MTNDNRGGNRGGNGLAKAAQGWHRPQGKQHPTDSSSNMNAKQLDTALITAGVTMTMRTIMTAMNRQDDKDNDDNRKGR